MSFYPTVLREHQEAQETHPQTLLASDLMPPKSNLLPSPPCTVPHLILALQAPAPLRKSSPPPSTPPPLTTKPTSATQPTPNLSIPSAPKTHTRHPSGLNPTPLPLRFGPVSDPRSQSALGLHPVPYRPPDHPDHQQPENLHVAYMRIPLLHLVAGVQADAEV
ncbi:hypothetical protein MMC17_003358 [Xylographa soralifera]|nr:hypothetical protein [Xylographa soralifera]